MKNLDTPLSKDELASSLKRKYFLAGDRKTRCYVFVDSLSHPNLSVNPGVPSMLITTISQFADKPKEKLVAEDAFNMSNSINFFLNEINYSTLKQWRKYVGLSFFGMQQYRLLEYYLDN